MCYKAYFIKSSVLEQVLSLVKIKEDKEDNLLSSNFHKLKTFSNKVDMCELALTASCVSQSIIGAVIVSTNRIISV